ncbi:hypothetical protein D9M68_789700 [compost metagenome]
MSASSSKCAVLPPGAEQASSTRMPLAGASSSAANCAPASCTDHQPSANPGNCVTGRGEDSTRPDWPTGSASSPATWNAASTCSRLARRRLTRKVSGAGTLALARISRHCCG